MPDRLRALALGLLARRSYDQRRAGPLPMTSPPADVIYAHPDDVELLRGWRALGLDPIGPGFTIYPSEHVPAGYVVTANPDVRDAVDTLLARYRLDQRRRLLDGRA